MSYYPGTEQSRRNRSANPLGSRAALGLLDSSFCLPRQWKAGQLGRNR